MIIRFLYRLIFGTIKKIVFFIVIIGLLVYGAFSGQLKKVTGWVYNVVTSKYDLNITGQTTGQQYNLTVDVKGQIDAWLFANKLNQYGDPEGTVYAGGTPLFDESTGMTKDRHEYVLEKYPQLKKLLLE